MMGLGVTLQIKASLYLHSYDHNWCLYGHQLWYLSCLYIVQATVAMFFIYDHDKF